MFNFEMGRSHGGSLAKVISPLHSPNASFLKWTVAHIWII